MRVSRFVLAAFVLVSTSVARSDEPPPTVPPADPWDSVTVVTLRDAAALGSVSTVGADPKSYQGVTLKLTNASKARTAVELAGAYLLPRTSCQRLALGPPVDVTATLRRPGGSSVVRLEPGETRSIAFNTCCMDAGLAAPTNQRFDVANTPMPPVRERVMRWWNDNPTAPQHAVNSAIWTNSPEVRVAPGVVEGYAEPKGRFIALHGGTCYRLVDGALTGVDADGVERVYGGGVFQVLPADGGLYAVMLGDDKKPKLWRLETTGESRWTQVLDLDGTDRVRRVIESGKGGLVVVADKSVAIRGGRAAASVPPASDRVFDDPTVRVADDGRLLVAMHQVPRAPVYQGGSAQHDQLNVFALWSVALDTGKAELVRRFWDVEGVLAGPGGVYAVTPTENRLRRLVADKFDAFGPQTASYRRVVASSAQVVWLADETDRLVAVETRTGRQRFRTELAAEDAKVFSVDPKTGDFGYVRGPEFRRIRAEDGRDESVAPR